MVTLENIEKNEYSAPVKENLNNSLSFFNSENIKNNIIGSKEFKNNLIKSQWKFTCENYKTNRNTRTASQFGDLYVIRGNYRKAINLYLEALSFDDKNITIYKKIINTLCEHKEFKEANEYFTELLKITDRFEILKDYIIFKTVSLDQLSNVDLVIDLIDKTLEKNSLDIDLINLKGFLLLNLKNKVDLAKNIFQQCLNINSNYIHAINNYGVCCLKEGENNVAEKYFKSGLENSSSGYPFVYQNLAFLYIKEQKKEEALDILERALFKNINLQNEYRHLYGYLLLDDLQLDKAKLWYQELLKKEDANNLLYNNLGVCYSREKKFDIAIKYFQKSIDLCNNQIKKGVIKDMRSLQAFYNRGRMAIQEGDETTVKKISENILLLSPNDVYALYFEGNYYLRIGEYKKARKMFDKVLSIDKNIPELYSDYSFLLVSIDKDYEEAVSLIHQAINLGYKNDVIYNNLAFAYIRSGELDMAEEIINEHKDSKIPTFIATKGLLELRKNNLEEGDECYKKAIKLLSGNDKIIASKIREKEIAEYWFNNKNFILAKKAINRIDNSNKTYFDSDIKELDLKIDIELNR